MLNRLLILSLILTSSIALADDLEIFRGAPNKSNVVFLMDTSGSMSYYTEIEPSDELPIEYDPKVTYPKVMNGFDSNAIYVANGLEFSGYNALIDGAKLKLNLGANFQRNMQRYKTNSSAIKGCTGMKEDLKKNGFWSYKRSRGGNNTKAKLWTSAKGWGTMPLSTTASISPGHLINLSFSDPSMDDRIVCRNDNPGWAGGWSFRYIEKVATGNYLNYLIASNRKSGKFVYARYSLLHNAITSAVSSLKGLNIALMRSSAGGTGNKVIVDGGAVTVPLMPIEDAGNRFDEEITKYMPGGLTAISETLHEALLYLTGKKVKYGGSLKIRTPRRTQVVNRLLNGLMVEFYLYPETRVDISNSVDHEGDRIIKNNKYVQPEVNECTPSDVIVFSDGEEKFGAFKPDVGANQDIRNLIKDLDNLPAGLSKNCGKIKCPLDFFTSEKRCEKNNGCANELAYYMANVDQYPNIGKKGSPNEKQIIRVHAIGGFLKDQSANDREKARKTLKSISTHGKGLYYEASTLVDLRKVIADAIANTVRVTSTFTAPNVPISATNRLQDSSDVYLPLFKTESLTNWFGNFKRYKLNDYNQIMDANNKPAIESTGLIKETAQSIWSASVDGNEVAKGGMASHLSVTRNVWVNYEENTLAKFEDSSIDEDDREELMALEEGSQQKSYNQLKDWALGKVDANTPRKSMEDIIHSTPLLVNYENTDDSSKPHQTIFVGSNSGFLHAFNPDKDKPSERYSFVPKSLFKNFKYYFFNEYGWVDHKPYGLDGAITSWHNDTNRNGIVDNGEKAYLYVGMRRGGHSYYALDISDKDKPKLKWEIHGNYPDNAVNKPDTTAGFERLGQTWSPMIPAEVRWKGEKKVVLFVGGGYNPVEDNRQGKPRTAYDNMGNTLYMIDADTGRVLWDARKHLGSNSSKMRNSLVTKPVPIDVTGNGLVDMLYVSDVGSRVWRFDFKRDHGTSDNANNFAKGGAIVEVNNNTVEHNHRFFTAPDISYYKGKPKPILISIGSGYRAHPLSESTKNRHYLIKDSLNPPTTYKALRGRDLKRLETQKVDSIVENNTQASNNKAIDANAPNGWKIFLQDEYSEKVLSESTTVKGQIFFTTYSPKVTQEAEDSEDCVPKYGVARLYTVDMHSIGKKKVLVKELEQTTIPAQPVVLFNRKADKKDGDNSTGGDGSTGGGDGSTDNSNNCENVGAVTMIGTEVVKNSLNRCGQVVPIYWREVNK